MAPEGIPDVHVRAVDVHIPHQPPNEIPPKIKRNSKANNKIEQRDGVEGGGERA